MKKKTLFERLEESSGLPPIVQPGPAVFTSGDYGRAIGIGQSQASARLRQLQVKGQVIKVRSKRSGTIRECWMFIGEGA